MSDKQALLKTLDEIAVACARHNWDGHRANRVFPATVVHVKQFIQLLPDDVALPEVCPEPDGSISLDWIQSKNCMFSASIAVSNRVSLAYVNGSDIRSGVTDFKYRDPMPDEILEYIGFVSAKGDDTNEI